MVQFPVAYLNQSLVHDCRPRWQDSLETQRQFSRPVLKDMTPAVNKVDTEDKRFDESKNNVITLCSRWETDSLGVCRCWEGQRKPVWSERQEANYSFIFVPCCQTRALFGVTVTPGMHWSKTIARGTSITIVFLVYCKVVVWQRLNVVGNWIFYHVVFA